MDTLHALLIFAAVIAIILIAGRWNASDADHYLGFEGLRQPGGRKTPNGDKNAGQERGDAEKE